MTWLHLLFKQYNYMLKFLDIRKKFTLKLWLIVEDDVKQNFIINTRKL